MQSEESNPIYARFMGEKYIVTKSKMKGVRLLGKSGEWKIMKMKCSFDHLWNKPGYE